MFNSYVRHAIWSMVKLVLLLYGVMILFLFGLVLASPSYTYHYTGETVVTAEQYTHVALTAKATGTATLSQEDDGPYVLTYDMYTDQPYEFLQGTPVQNRMLDNPVIGDARRRSYFESLRNTAITLLITCLIFAVAYRFYRHVTKPFIALNRWITKTKHSRLSILPPLPIANVLPIGIVGVRSWKFVNRQLTSIAQGGTWPTKELTADVLPTKDNFAGIHAYRIGTPVVMKDEVMGIVDLRGKWQYHPDGVIRAENGRILRLFISNASWRLEQYLQSKYRVPIHTASTAMQAYLEWLYSDAGLESLARNQKIIGE